MSSRFPNSLLPLALCAALIGCTGPDVTDTTDTDDVGNDGLGALAISPCDVAGYDFGLVELNSLSSATLRATNSGLGDAAITSMSVDSPFSVNSSNVTVGAGSSYAFTVRFQPTTFGDFQTDLTVTYNDGEADHTLSCAFRGSVTGDADDDGYINIDAGGDDCDDEDAAVHPDAIEQYYDGIDADCDGASDFDQDGDGYESDVFNSDSSTGGDCQDVDASIHPGADDVFYDGVDSDCDDANDFDQDLDGYSSKEYGGDDCDDYDSSVNSAGVEAFDGADNNCNGKIDDGASASEAQVSIYGDAADEAAGRSLAVGDFDGDGTADLVIGAWYSNYSGSATDTYGDAQGAVSVFMDGSWTDGDKTSDGDNWIDGAGSTDEFGYAVANIGDYDADGYDDLAVSAPAYDSRAGRVYLFSGSDIEAGTVSSAFVSFTGSDDYRLGMGLGTKTDVDGDGMYDAVMYGVNSWNTYNYFAIDYGGTGTGEVAWSDIDSTWVLQCGEAGTSTRPYCGTYSSTAQGGSEMWGEVTYAGADIDGDGYHDLVLGDPYNDDNAKQGGKAWILWGRSAEYSNSGSSLGGTASTIAAGDSVKDFIGQTVMVTPDANGDGAAEVWIGDGKAEAMYFFYGSTDLRSGEIDLASSADATFDIGSDDITGVANTGDWTGDGVGDFAIAMGNAGSGELWFYETQAWSGSYVLTDASTASLLGGDDNENFGLGIAPLNMDLNSDGTEDLAVGDYGYVDGQGSVHLFYQY